MAIGLDRDLQEGVRRFREALGVAFQFQDDYLDMWGEAWVLVREGSTFTSPSTSPCYNGDYSDAAKPQ